MGLTQLSKNPKQSTTAQTPLLTVPNLSFTIPFVKYFRDNFHVKFVKKQSKQKMNFDLT